jgi:uncharacterized protein YodC (DUF2158 family)
MLTVTLDQSERFCVGDVVTLKSGGARMTVTYVSSGEVEGDWLVCQWFDEHGEFRQDRFALTELVREPRSISLGRARLHRHAGLPGS